MLVIIADNLTISYCNSIDCSDVIKRPARDACLCIGDLQAPPAPHFVFLITL